MQLQKKLIILALTLLACTSSALGFVPPPPPPAGDTANPNVGALTPSELWNLDTKLDDGLPISGNMVVNGPAASSWSKCTDAASKTATTGNYNLASTSTDCAIIFRNQF